MGTPSNIFRSLRIIIIGFTVFININFAQGAPLKPVEVKDVYITINNSTARLQQLFELIEQQTPFTFAYDENDVNLSKQLKLITGQQLLNSVLDKVAEQTGLHFVEKANLILVKVTKKVNELQATDLTKINSIIKGTVRDSDGVPLMNVTVAIKGSTGAVQTDAEGNFSINAPNNAILVFTIVGYKQQEIVVKGESTLVISMQTLNKDLNEVVIVG